jgi:glycosyltransferase involved in cell wall biosynthesis
MHTPDISVVITTYNRRIEVARAINSVLVQTGIDFELIVVDDASTDDTQLYLKSINDRRLITIAISRNVGPSGARNRGLDAARAGLVAFLDSDDRYLAHRLSAPLAAFAADPELVCVLSASIKHARTHNRQESVPDVRLAPAAFEWALICDLIPVETSSITVRREQALAVGGFCERLRLSEDREFLIRLARHGAARLLPDLLWEKSWTENSLSNDRSIAGQGLLGFFAERPEYLTRFRKLGRYLATKRLVDDLRDGHWRTFFNDWVAFRRQDIVGFDVIAMARDHREVRHYRRSMSKRDKLASLIESPSSWH